MNFLLARKPSEQNTSSGRLQFGLDEVDENTSDKDMSRDLTAFDEVIHFNSFRMLCKMQRTAMHRGWWRAQEGRVKVYKREIS